MKIVKTLGKLLQLAGLLCPEKIKSRLISMVDYGKFICSGGLFKHSPFSALLSLVPQDESLFDQLQ